MKCITPNLICTLLFSWILHVPGAAQEKEYQDTAKYYCKYLLTYQSDSTDVNTVAKEEMILLVGSKLSIFSSMKVFLRDSFLNSESAKDITAAQAISFYYDLPKSKFPESITKIYSENRILFSSNIALDQLEYEEPLNLFKWHITNEKKEIAGLNCTKATTEFMGRSYTAWFANDIPIFDGPYKFSKLPGLIVNISDSKGHYNYTLLEFKPGTKHAMKVNSKANLKVSKKEFHATEKDFYANYFERGDAAFGVTRRNIDPVVRKRTEDRLKKRNNPIELLHD